MVDLLDLKNSLLIILPPAYEYTIDKIQAVGNDFSHFSANFKIKNVFSDADAQVTSFNIFILHLS